MKRPRRQISFFSADPSASDYDPAAPFDPSVDYGAPVFNPIVAPAGMPDYNPASLGGGPTVAGNQNSGLPYVDPGFPAGSGPDKVPTTTPHNVAVDWFTGAATTIARGATTLGTAAATRALYGSTVQVDPATGLPRLSPTTGLPLYSTPSGGTTTTPPTVGAAGTTAASMTPLLIGGGILVLVLVLMKKR